MLIVQLSNIFNLIIQNNPNLKTYHFGYPNDVNINVQNNYNQGAQTGNNFPYVLFIPPNISSRIQQNATQSIFDTYSCQLLFIDMYGYENDSVYKPDTTAVVLSELQKRVKEFFKELQQYAEILSLPPFNISDLEILVDAINFFVQNTRTLSVTFNLTFPSGCSDFDVDLTPYLPENPNDMTDDDLEYVIPNYCPLGFNAKIPLVTSSIKGDWTVFVDPNIFLNQILAHPNYVGGLVITFNQMQNVGGVAVGNNVLTGDKLNTDSIPLSNASVFYNLKVTAFFDLGSGPHEINYSLLFEVPQPADGALFVKYFMDSYICTDITATQA
jgi:hypothetical protein